MQAAPGLSALRMVSLVSLLNLQKFLHIEASTQNYVISAYHNSEIAHC